MTIFDNIDKMTLTNAHGEVNFFKIESGTVPEDGWSEFTSSKNGFVVGHSESGHNHVLERPSENAVSMRRARDSKGMEILHAIVREPLRLFQEAGDPHAEQVVEPGENIITNNVETSPFTKQARRVAD